jgi:3-phosphoshikimate 1-carboxyvinyltransferase
MQDVQGDKKLIPLLIELGANIEIDDHEKTITVKKGSSLKGGKIDINPLIDAVTILAVLSCFASEPIEIFNGAIARRKESDRIHAIATELKKMGAKVEEKTDGLIIYPSSLKGAAVSTHQDHRMGLSLAVAALGAKGNTRIQGIECISKSYPFFCRSFKQIGAKIEEIV